MNYSVIIPFRRDSLERELNLWFVAEHYAKQGADVCIVEHSERPTLSGVPYQYRHIEAEPDQLFNKSMACNAGAAMARTDTLVFMDSDCFLELPIGSLPTLGGACFPASERIMLDAQDSNAVRLGRWPSAEMIGRADRVHWNNSDGCSILTREAFETVNGWRENIEGWGGDSLALEYCCRQLVPTLLNVTRLFHLWHPIAPARLPGSPEAERNRQRLGDLMAMHGDELRCFIHGQPRTE